jgi:hypothetical protein
MFTGLLFLDHTAQQFTSNSGLLFLYIHRRRTVPTQSCCKYLKEKSKNDNMESMVKNKFYSHCIIFLKEKVFIYLYLDL